MECQSSDSKKLFKVFDSSKCKRTRRKRDGLDDTNSVVTDESTSGCQGNSGQVPSAKASLQEISTEQTLNGQPDAHLPKRDRDSSPSITRSPVEIRRTSRSPRRHRRSTKEGISLALKAGLVNSTPRSMSPRQEGDGVGESVPQDQDSFIYAFLEEAIKKDKKKQRHARRREERRHSGEDDREPSTARDRRGSHEKREQREQRVLREPHEPRDRHRHHHRHRDDPSSRKLEKQPKTVPPAALDQAILFQTFAKLCSQLNDKPTNSHHNFQVPRTHSHKSLQCEVVARRDTYDIDRHPVRLRSHSKSRDVVIASKIRSQENFAGRMRSHEKIGIVNDLERVRQEKCLCYYEKEVPKYPCQLDMTRSRLRNLEDDRYREHPTVAVPTRSCVEPFRTRSPEVRDFRDYEREVRGKHYDDDKRRYFEQKTSRSFDLHREGYEEERGCRRTARSETNKERRYDDRDKRFEEVPKYYDDKASDPRDRHNGSCKERRWRRNVERFDRNSVASRDDDYRDRDRDRDRDRERERDRYSEKERDSGLSVADGETSTISGKSNYLKVVKQEIAEQREAMDKMMRLWKELMRCFKGISQTQVQDKNVRESASNVRESAAAQLRLWRECMRRYETVARDVGDTDARLMEEIKKQRSEMAEMATMWQECLQRYRDMSNDFNNLKQQLVTPESPTRQHAPPLVCAEGEGIVPTAPYRLPPNYLPPIPSPAGGGYPAGGSPLRGRASAPPAWWWCPDPAPRSPRRRSSPDSRASRDREHRHRHKDRDESRYKEKSSKPSAARSEHRHRKR